MERRRKVAWLVVVAALCLALVPAIDAAARTTRQSATERKQNKAISALVVKTTTLTSDVAGLVNKSNTQGTAITGIDTRLKAIEAAAPVIIDGLSKLKDGLTAAGDGLNKLKTLATSTEYGIGQVFIAGVPAGGSFVVTPDIPDTVNQAQVSQVFVAGSAGVISVQVGVRSAESDGAGGVPAAHCRVTVVLGANITTSKPNAAVGGAPFYPINAKSTQTSTTPANAGFPFGPKVSGADADNLTDLTDTSGGGNATAPTGTPATVAGAGQTYSVTLACVDLSPDATDPSA
jgi:hypothetical protein